MKQRKQILCALAVAVLLTLQCFGGTLSAHALVSGYGIAVGGVEVTESNASDVLGDGTVSYDAAANTLTLNNANITEYFVAENFGEDGFFGVYNERIGLKLVLQGSNKIAIKDPMDDDTAAAIFSKKPMEIEGPGRLEAVCWSLITCMGDLTVRGCEITASTFGLSAMGNITVEDATLSAGYSMIATEGGNITLRRTTVTDGGSGFIAYTNLGSVVIEDSELTSNSANSVMIGEGGGSLLIQNTKLDLTSKNYAIMNLTGKTELIGVSGKITAMDEAAYGVFAGGELKLTDCELDITCRATEDGAGCVASSSNIIIQNSKLNLEARAPKEAAIGIGGMEAEAVNVTAEESELKLAVTGLSAGGIYAGNVKLTDCVTAIEATAANNEGNALGIVAEQGRVVVQGGALDVLATCSGNGELPFGCVFMSNPVLKPEITNAEVKLRGNRTVAVRPDLSQYTDRHGIFAGGDIYGEVVMDYEKDAIEQILFLHIYPLYSVSFDGNGGQGEILESEPLYGEYTLPENAFTPPEGKKFKGWSISKDGELLAEGAVYRLNGDVTFYAVWEDVEQPTEPGVTDEPTVPVDPNHTHSFGSDWKQTESEHYKACACGQKQYVGAHADSNENGSCDVCGAKLTESGEQGLGTGAIIGIVAGSAAVVGGGVFALWWFVLKKKAVKA